MTSRPKHVLQPLKGGNIAKYPMLAVDVENNSTTGKFICAGIYGHKKSGRGNINIVDEYFDDQDKFVEFLNNLKSPLTKMTPCRLCFFNLSYDKVFFKDIIDENKTIRTPHGPIIITLKNGLKAFDLTNIVDGSLEDWVKSLEMEKEHGVYKPDLKDLKLRVMMDAKATFYLAEYLQNFANNELGITLTTTIASLGFKFFRTSFFDGFWVRPDNELNDFERKAYYGGRVETFKRGEQFVASHDVNSMYVSVMKNESFPNPNSAMELKNATSLDEVLGLCDFILDCDIYLPMRNVGLMPHHREKDGKLIFPCGHLSGTWCSPEIEFMLQNGGRIKKIRKLVIYKKSSKFLSRYAEHCYTERMKYSKHLKVKDENGNKIKNPMNYLWKKLGNAVYGKFAQRNSIGSYCGRLEDYEGNLEGNFYENNGMLIISSTVKEDAFMAFPSISAFVCSHARVKLLKRLLKNEQKVVYCDTDSCKVLAPVNSTKKDFDDTKELGGWGFEYVRPSTFVRSKMYYDEGISIGKDIFVLPNDSRTIKGIPKKNAIVILQKPFIYAIFRRPNKEKESIRQELVANQWRIRMKKLKIIDDKRLWINNENSLPFYIS